MDVQKIEKDRLARKLKEVQNALAKAAEQTAEGRDIKFNPFKKYRMLMGVEFKLNDIDLMIDSILDDIDIGGIEDGE